MEMDWTMEGRQRKRLVFCYPYNKLLSEWSVNQVMSGEFAKTLHEPPDCRSSGAEPTGSPVGRHTVCFSCQRGKSEICHGWLRISAESVGMCAVLCAGVDVQDVLN